MNSGDNYNDMCKEVLEDVILFKREMSSFLFSVSMWKKLLMEYQKEKNGESSMHKISRFVFFEHCCITLMRMWDGGKGSLSFFKVGEYLEKREFIDFLNKRIAFMKHIVEERESDINKICDIIKKYRSDYDIFLDVRKRNKGNDEKMIKELERENLIKMFVVVLIFRNKLYAHVDNGSFIDNLKYGYIGKDYFDEIKNDMIFMIAKLSDIFGDGSGWRGEYEVRMYDEAVQKVVIP